MHKPLHTILLLAAALLFTACSTGSDDGKRLGRELAAAWNDSTALDSVLTAIAEARDGMTFAGSFDEALVEEAARSGQLPIEMAAYLLTESDENFADDRAQDIVDGLLNNTTDAATALARLNAAHAAATRLGREEAAQALNDALDEKAASLSVADQMKVYAAASTPAALGHALADDAGEPDADMAKINRQIEALRSIYNAQDFKVFFDSYNGR